MSDSSASAKTSSRLTNPLVGKLSKVQKNSAVHATQRGVFHKCAYFMLMIALGVAVAIVLHAIPCEGITDENGITVKYSELIGGGLAFLLFLVCPFIAGFAHKTTPVSGTLTCLAIGCFVTLVGLLLPGYGGMVLAALVMTFSVVFAMQLLFIRREVRTTPKIRKVIYAAIATYIIGGMLLLIGNLIPGLREMYVYLSKNAGLSILTSVLGAVLAILFLMADFDTIHTIIEEKLPREYEWSASFSLCFTVIWLYLEIFSLLSNMTEGKQN